MKIKKLLVGGALLVSSVFGGISAFNNSKQKIETFAENECIAHLGFDGKTNTGYVANDRNELTDKVGVTVEVHLDGIRNYSIFKLLEHEQYVSDIETIEFLSEVNCLEAANLFKDLTSLKNIKNLNLLNTSRCVSMRSMFSSCESLENIDLSQLNTENAIDFSYMFENCMSLTSLDLTTFKTDNVSDISHMFDGCSKLETIKFPSFSEPSITHMDYTFDDCTSLKEIDLSGFNLKKLSDNQKPLYGIQPFIIKSPAVLPDNVTIDFYLPLYNDNDRFYFDSDLNFYTKIGKGVGEVGAGKIVYLDDLYDKAYGVAEDLIFNTMFFLENGIIKDEEEMFKYWEKNYLMFRHLTEEDYNGIAASVLKNANENTPISLLKDYVLLYDKIYNDYKYIIDKGSGDFLERCPDAGKPDGLIHLGYDDFYKIGYISNVNSYEVLNCKYHWKFNQNNTREGSIFSTSPNAIDYSNMNKIIIQNKIILLDAEGFFKNLSNVKEISGLENLDVAEVINFSSMFEGCSSLEKVDLSSLNFNNVKSIDGMFNSCSSLMLVDISSIKTSSITMSELFAGCSSLYEVDLSQFDFSKVGTYFNIFYHARALAIKTPKNVSTDISLPLGLIPAENKFYDLSFNEYTLLPKNNASSMLLVGEEVKYQVIDFCDRFNDECSLICKADGNSDIDKIKKLWGDTSETAKDHFSEEKMPWVMEFLKQDNSNHKCNELKEFSGKYDYIYSKYYSVLKDNGGNFANRTFDSKNLLLEANYFENLRSDESVKIILLVSIISCSALLALCVTSKKIN